MTLKAGDLVYRVCEVDQPDGEVTWKVESARVKVATERSIQLATLLPGLWNRRFQPEALGMIFHATKREAIAVFKKQAKRRIETASNEIVHANNAIRWATKRQAKLDEG